MWRETPDVTLFWRGESLLSHLALRQRTVNAFIFVGSKQSGFGGSLEIARISTFKSHNVPCVCQSILVLCRLLERPVINKIPKNLSRFYVEFTVVAVFCWSEYSYWWNPFKKGNYKPVFSYDCQTSRRLAVSQSHLCHMLGPSDLYMCWQIRQQ